jgi:hypothetical protein
MLPLGADGHLVHAAGIGIVDEMTDVRDVHHLLGQQSEVLERPASDIGREIAVQVADVLVVVDRRPAVVDTDLARNERRERLDRARGAVEQLESGQSRAS